MALVAVVDMGAADAALAWSRRLEVPLGDPAGGAGVKLLVGPSGLALAFADPARGKPYLVDFTTASWRQRFAQPLARSHIFRRAIGECATLVDATAGFGQDAVLAASLGCRVVAVERSAVVAALLREGIERAVREDELIRAKLTGFELVEAEAISHLASCSTDVVYIDPMFVKPKKTAKSPKEMQLLQELLGPPALGEDERLFAAAFAAAKKRVVVKRPLKARALKSAPTHSFKGQSVRYDVYVKS